MGTLGTTTGKRESKLVTNSIMVITPYKYAGTWVFDDPSVDLVREPFVCGIPEIIDTLVADIPNATAGFRLMFSSVPFPGHTVSLLWLREDSGGNWYQVEGGPADLMVGWLCPALFKYFDEAPRNLYAKEEAI